MNSAYTKVWGQTWWGRGYEQCMHYSLGTKMMRKRLWTVHTLRFEDKNDEEEVMNSVYTTIWGLKWRGGSYEQCNYHNLSA